MPACQLGRHSSCWLCLMSRWLLYSVMIPDPTWTLQTNLHWPRSAAGATCVTRALVRVSPVSLCGAIQSDSGTLNIFTGTGLFVTRFMWSLLGSQTPGREMRRGLYWEPNILKINLYNEFFLQNTCQLATKINSFSLNHLPDNPPPLSPKQQAHCWCLMPASRGCRHNENYLIQIFNGRNNTHCAGSG